MKRSIAIFALILLTVCTSVTTYARNDKRPWKEEIAAMTPAQKEQRIAEIKARVLEIKDMDKSKLSKEDRKALRQELRDMQKQAKDAGGGIYLSVGAIIIIILVLILIL